MEGLVRAVPRRRSPQGDIRRALVTGATGFIGAHLCAWLAGRGVEVIGLTRRRMEDVPSFRRGDDTYLVHGDATDLRLVGRTLAEYEPDTVFHLAGLRVPPAEAARAPLDTFEANARAAWVLLEAARRARCAQRIVLLSSVEAHGRQSAAVYTEELPLRGGDLYAASTASADLVAQTFAATYRLPVAIARTVNVFGPGDLDWRRLVPGAIRAWLRGGQPPVPASAWASFIFVHDLVEGLGALAEALGRDPALAGEAFNLVGEEGVGAAVLLRQLEAIVDAPRPPAHDLAGPRSCATVSNRKARRRLEWAPRYALDTALRRTVGWYRDHLGAEPRRARA